MAEAINEGQTTGPILLVESLGNVLFEWSEVPAPASTAAGITSVVAEDASTPGGPKRFVLKGKFGVVDEATANKRLYGKSLWEREIKRLGSAMGERRVFGELDHPADGKGSYWKVSHIVTGLNINGGEVSGVAEALDTPGGQILQTLIKAGCRLGVSSRGYGSVRPNQEGVDVVQPDYQLNTFDVVIDPAAGAFPEAVQEDIKRINAAGGVAGLTEDVLRTQYPALVEAIEKRTNEGLEAVKVSAIAEGRRLGKAEAQTELRAEFQQEITSQITNLKVEATAQAREELEKDPSIIGAKTAMESVRAAILPFILPEQIQAEVARVTVESTKKVDEALAQVAEKALTITDLTKKLEEANAEKATLTTQLAETKTELDGLHESSKKLAFQFHFAQLLEGEPEKELVRTLIGPLTAFNEMTDLTTRVKAVRSDLAVKRSQVEAVTQQKNTTGQQLQEEKQKQTLNEAVESVRREKQAEIDQLLKDNDKLVEDVGRSDRDNETLKLRLYAEGRLTGNPRALKIREVLRLTPELNSEAQVDQIIESFKTSPVVEGTTESAADRVRQLTRAGRGSSALEEEGGSPSGTPPTTKSRGPEGLAKYGINIDRVRQLS